RDFILGEGPRDHTEVDVCTVTSVTREGMVKAVRKATWATEVKLAHWVHPHQICIVPKDKVDVPAAMAEAARKQWPSGHPGMYFESLDEVREMLKRHKTD